MAPRCLSRGSDTARLHRPRAGHPLPGCVGDPSERARCPSRRHGRTSARSSRPARWGVIRAGHRARLAGQGSSATGPATAGVEAGGGVHRPRTLQRGSAPDAGGPAPARPTPVRTTPPTEAGWTGAGPPAAPSPLLRPTWGALVTPEPVHDAAGGTAVDARAAHPRRPRRDAGPVKGHRSIGQSAERRSRPSRRWSFSAAGRDHGDLRCSPARTGHGGRPAEDPRLQLVAGAASTPPPGVMPPRAHRHPPEGAPALARPTHGGRREPSASAAPCRQADPVALVPPGARSRRLAQARHPTVHPGAHATGAPGAGRPRGGPSRPAPGWSRRPVACPNRASEASPHRRRLGPGRAAPEIDGGLILARGPGRRVTTHLRDTPPAHARSGANA